MILPNILRQEEKAWWNKFGDYMTHQWKLTPRLRALIRTELESNFVSFLLKPGGSLLDLGCGSGWLSLYFSEHNMYVTGIDISAKQIEAAKQLKRERENNRATFECADFATWDTTPHQNSFDSVFVSAFLHHLPEDELEQTFQKIAILVKPGGRVFLYEPLTSARRRSHLIKGIDLLCSLALLIFLGKLPKWFDLTSERHANELARGYRMQSPHERPVDVALLKKLIGSSFDICEIKGWHLHSLGFSMQVTSLKKKVQKYYEWLGGVWYSLDRLLLGVFGWESFSLPGRFILCGVKLIKK